MSARQPRIVPSVIDERAVLVWNANESIRRTREALRQAHIREARQQFSYQQGVPVKLHTEDEIQRAYPEPEQPYDLSLGPMGRYVDDSKPNNFGAVSLMPDEKRRLWFQLLQQQRPPENAASANMAEVDSLSLRIRERRR